MTITEIIDGLEKVQRTQKLSYPLSTFVEDDITSLCTLAKALAIHVQQLEVDLTVHTRVLPSHTCVDRPNIPCSACGH